MQKDMPEDIRERKENFPMKKVGSAFGWNIFNKIERFRN